MSSRPGPFHGRSGRGARFGAPAVLFVAACAGVLNAQDGPPARPDRALLRQLAAETRALHEEMGRGVLRVQLPPPRWLDVVAADEPDNPLTKYKGLDPKVREQLERRAGRAASPEGEPVARAAEAGPFTRAATDVDLQPGSAPVIVVPPPKPARPQPSAAAGPASAAAFSANNVALVLDDRGHLLVPLYLEREAAAAGAIRVRGPDGALVDARFVGSDRQTNLTVLQMTQPAGDPVGLGEEERPADGSLVLTVAPHDGAERLGLWTGAATEYGVVFSVDGRCRGVARFGQFLSARACRLIAEQIIRHGAVKRATLGVIITQVPRADGGGNAAATVDRSGIGSGNAMRVDQVMPDSPADRAGIRPGDLVLTLAGQSVGDLASLAAAIAARSGPTEMTLSRGGRVLTVTVELQQK
jgi:hypothetical protein